MSASGFNDVPDVEDGALHVNGHFDYLISL